MYTKIPTKTTPKLVDLNFPWNEIFGKISRTGKVALST